MRRGLILAAAGAMFLGACSSSSSSSTVTPPASSGGGGGGNTLSLTTKDFTYTPTALTASAGTVKVTITNDGPSLHNFTLDDNSVSQDIPTGTSQTVTLNLSGSVSFHCKYHPTKMKGTITVGSAELTTTTPKY